jgi:hypothetical protein
VRVQVVRPPHVGDAPFDVGGVADGCTRRRRRAAAAIFIAAIERG